MCRNRTYLVLLDRWMQLGTCLEILPACRVWTSDLLELCSPAHTSWWLETQCLLQSNSRFHHFSVNKKFKWSNFLIHPRHFKGFTSFRRDGCAYKQHVKFSATLRLLLFFKVEFNISIWIDYIPLSSRVGDNCYVYMTNCLSSLSGKFSSLAYQILEPSAKCF